MLLTIYVQFLKQESRPLFLLKIAVWFLITFPFFPKRANIYYLSKITKTLVTFLRPVNSRHWVLQSAFLNRTQASKTWFGTLQNSCSIPLRMKCFIIMEDSEAIDLVFSCHDSEKLRLNWRIHMLKDLLYRAVLSWNYP